MLVANWNLEWATRRSSRRQPIINKLFDLKPEIICLTEAYLDFLPEYGYQISAAADYGYKIKKGRRKVILWSENQWHFIDQAAKARMPSGRYIYGETRTSQGKIGVHGICIPWARAHVATGKKIENLGKITSIILMVKKKESRSPKRLRN